MVDSWAMPARPDRKKTAAIRNFESRRHSGRLAMPKLISHGSIFMDFYLFSENSKWTISVIKLKKV